MAKTTRELRGLLKRVQAVGWGVRYTGSGQPFVTAPDGESMAFSGSRDSRVHKNNVAWAVRHGLREDEAALATRQQNARTARLAADRNRVNGAGPAPQQERASVLFVEPRMNEGESDMPPRRSPDMYDEIVEVTAEWALKHLTIALPPLADGTEIQQRKLYQSDVREWKDVIRRGEFVEAHPQGIFLAPNGACLNGQHRLNALLDLASEDMPGLTLKMKITHNVPPDLFPTIDTGRPRTSMDMLHIIGEKDATQLSSALKLLFCYLQWEADPDGAPHWLKWGHQPLTQPQRLQLLREHPGIRDAVAASGMAKRIGAPRAAVAVWRYLALREWPSRTGQARFDEFWQQLATGEMLIYGDPAKTLLDWFTLRKGDAMTMRRERFFIAITKGWNRFCNNDRFKHVKVPDNEPMIRPYRPKRAPAPEAR